MAQLLKRRRATVALGMSGDRGSLVADLKAEKAQAEAEARQKLYDQRQADALAKEQKAETWAKEINRVKTLAQQFQDDGLSLKDFKAEIEKSKGKFADNTDDLDSLFRQAVRNRDTIKYNNYINGGVQYDDFKDYVQNRRKDGGDLSNLENLFSQARLHEDTNQYNLYKGGVISFDQLKQYQAGRQKDGGDLTKLNGYVGLAKTNENQINDQLEAAKYQSGGDAAAYKSYLQGRIADATDPKEATALRTAMKSVETNEVMKAADDVRAQYEAGQITGGEAVMRLMGVKSSTSDSSTQTKVLNLVGQIQNADKAKGHSATAAVNAIVTNLKNLENDARGDYDKEQSALSARLAKADDPGDYQRLSDQLYVSYTKYRSAVSRTGELMPDEAWKANFQAKTKGLDATFSGQLYLAAKQISDNMTKVATNEKTGVNLAKYGEASKFLIGTASENPHMGVQDRQKLIQDGIQTLKRGRDEWDQSSEGIQWRDFVTNRTRELLDLGGRAMDKLAASVGVDPTAARNGGLKFVESVLLKDPDLVREALKSVGAEGYVDNGLKINGEGKFVTGKTADDWSKTIAGLTPTLRSFQSAADDLYTKHGVIAGMAPMNAIDLAYNDIYNPERRNTNNGYGDINEMKYGEIAAQNASNEPPTSRASRKARDEDFMHPEPGEITANPNALKLTEGRNMAFTGANQREDRGEASYTPPDVAGYEALKRKLNPYTMDEVQPSVFRGNANDREDRIQDLNGYIGPNNGPAPKSLSLQSVDAQSAGGGVDMLDASDPYAYLQNILKNRESEWQIQTPPTSDILPPEEVNKTFGGFGNSGSGQSNSSFSE